MQNEMVASARMAKSREAGTPLAHRSRLGCAFLSFSTTSLCRRLRDPFAAGPNTPILTKMTSEIKLYVTKESSRWVGFGSLAVWGYSLSNSENSAGAGVN